MKKTHLAALALVHAALSSGCGDDAGASGASGGGGDTGGAQASGTRSTGTESSGTESSGTQVTSGDGGGDASSTATGTSAVASGGVGGGTGEWQPLITSTWSLEPGGENTSQLTATVVDHDMYIGAIRPIAPFGTHHTVLALDGFETANYIYASGVGTNEVVFPPGVGLKISAGQSVVLQLHIFNPSPDALNETSGIEVIELSPEDVVEEADIFLPGPLGLNIPPHQETTISGTCTVDAPQNIFALFPHMHQLGAHFKTTLSLGGEVQVLHDEDYSFDHQPFLSFEPIALAPGDQIETACTWNNTGDQDLHWGESSTAEMCFSILYRWPAQPGESFCN